MNWITRIVLTVLIIALCPIIRVGFTQLGGRIELIDGLLCSFVLMWFIAILIDIRK